MSRRRPEPRALDIRAFVGERRRTRNGNWYLQCETDQGVTVFWGSDGNLHNISRIEKQPPPFRVTCGCLASNWSAHDLWVPEGSALEMHASGDSRPPGKGVADAPRRVSPLRTTRDDDHQAAEDWMDARELVALELRCLVKALFKRRTPIPVVGFELTGNTGVVLAEAELAWPERNVAVLLSEQRDSKPAFEQAGWQVFHGEMEDAADALAAALNP